MSNITFHVELLSKVLPEMLVLSLECYSEVDQHNDLEFNPDIDTYMEIEKQGALRFYSIRDNNEMVGFMLFIIGPYLQRKGSKSATSEVMYIRKGYRGHGNLLIEEIKEDLKELGVHLMSVVIKGREEVPSKFAVATGTCLYEKVYQARLD